MRGLDILANHGLNVKVLKLDREDVKDPDEYLNKYGPERLKKCVENAISLVEFKVSILEKNLDLNNFDSKVKFLTGVSNILSKIDNNIERDLYIDKISKKYGMSPGPILKEVEKGVRNKKEDELELDMNSLNKKMQLITSVRKRQEQYIIALLLSKKKKIQEEILKNISSEDIEDENVRKIFDFILSLKDEYDINKIDILSKIQDEDMIKEITDIMYIDISGYEEKLLQDVLKNKKKDKLFTRRDEIIKRLGDNISNDESEILKVELNQIVIELSKLK
jgi:DNA primase